MREPMPPVADVVFVTLSFKEIDIEVDIFQRGGVAVEDEEFRSEDLIPPDGGVVGASDIPCSKYRKISIDSERVNSAFRLCTVQELSEI